RATRPLSTTHIGTTFENRSLHVLQSQLSMSLTKVGGKADGGIDLQGWWWLPVPSDGAARDVLTWTSPGGIVRRRIRVLGQCKAEAKKLGPRYVRELEGVLARYTTRRGDAQQANVGLVVSQSPFTRATVLCAFSSPMPLFLFHLPPEPEADADGSSDGGVQGGIGSAVWNPALGASYGLLRGEIEARWERPIHGGVGRPGLWWKGEKLNSW
ncbi:hypothetical protein BU17DRAFT_28875, partial [Hysterangium stoloniferum]